MRPVRISVGPLATAGTTKVCASQTPSGAGDMTINGTAASGGVATLDTYRRVLFTFGADESAKTFTVYGTGRDGTQSETVTGTASTAYTTLDYLTVTRIAVSAATTAALTVGTNGIASSAWVCLDVNGPPQTSLQINLSGTINATVQQTLDDVWTPSTKASALWVSHPDTNLVGMTSATTPVQGNYAYVPCATRLTINSGTGSAAFDVVQPGPGVSLMSGLNDGTAGLSEGTGLNWHVGLDGGPGLVNTVGSTPPVISNGILLENGVDFLMLEDGTSYLLQES